ncbi:MAG: alpha/beta hydrolase [Actinomycetota bacterium]|nr:alpha/beta hydrolase [Actinomycetota bacterium]
MGLAEDSLMSVSGLYSRLVLVESGVRIHYVTAGEDGPAVVLLHGGGPGSSGTAAWHKIAPFLGSKGFRVYCPDLPGFGLTRVPEDAAVFGRGGHRHVLHEFVNALGIDRFHLGGTWTGSDTVAGYTCANPDRVTSFALIAGPVGDILSQDEMRALDSRPPNERPQIAKFDGTEESMRAAMTAITHDPRSVRDDAVRMRTAAANLQSSTFARHQACLADSDPNLAASLSIKGRFDVLTTPGICIWGRSDSLAPLEAGFALEDRLPNVDFFYPEGVGHQDQNERLEIFTSVLLEFFRDGAVGSSTAEIAGISRRRTGLP